MRKQGSNWLLRISALLLFVQAGAHSMATKNAVVTGANQGEPIDWCLHCTCHRRWWRQPNLSAVF